MLRSRILWIGLFILVGMLPATAQCVPNAKGGTDCVGPLQIIPSTPASSPTSLFVITPATTKFPCVSGIADSGHWVVCYQDLSLMIDVGDGKGYRKVYPTSYTLTCDKGIGTIGKGFTSKCTQY